MRGLLKRLKLLRRYPSLALGLIIILGFVLASLYAVTALPYSEAIRLWRGGPGVWDETPKTVPPVWFDFFTRDKLSRTMKVTGDSQTATHVEALDDETNLVTIELPFNYTYDGFPTELNLFIEASSRATMSPQQQDFGKRVGCDESHQFSEFRVLYSGF